MSDVNEYTSLVGARVRSHREARQWNQQQLAERAGVSQPTISRIEKGRGVLDGAAALQLADGLEVRVGALLGPAMIRDQVVTAGRPADEASAMETMKAAAQCYLADFRRVTNQA